jgi:hypothetical protein
MFRPGSFSFDTRGPNTISLALIGTIDSTTDRETGFLAEVMNRVRVMLDSQNK